MKTAHYLDKSQGKTIKNLFTAIMIDAEVAKELARSMLRHLELLMKTKRIKNYNMIEFEWHLFHHNDFSCFEFLTMEKYEELLRQNEFYVVKLHTEH